MNIVGIGNFKHMDRVDFHTHILPNIDDGSNCEKDSYEMLKIEQLNRVKQVIATPHFYPDQLSPHKFTNRRKNSYDRLMTYISGQNVQNVPDIVLGAEVLLALDTAYMKDLRLLAIENTDYILIELPYMHWKEWVYESIERIRVVHGLIPIIAHVERYISFGNDLEDIYNMMIMPGVLAQVNIESILAFKTRTLCKKLIRNNMAHVIGSDAHRIKHLQKLDITYKYIMNKYGNKKMEELDLNANLILDNAEIIKREPIMFKRLCRYMYI